MSVVLVCFCWSLSLFRIDVYTHRSTHKTVISGSNKNLCNPANQLCKSLSERTFSLPSDTHNHSGTHARSSHVPPLRTTNWIGYRLCETAHPQSILKRSYSRIPGGERFSPAGRVEYIASAHSQGYAGFFPPPPLSPGLGLHRYVRI